MTLHDTIAHLVAEAKELHRPKQPMTLRSTWIVGRLEKLHARLRTGKSIDAFAKDIGLTKNSFWKRAQAARVLECFPIVKTMVEAGQLEISSVALFSPKLTEANQHLVLEAVKNKSKHEVESILARITLDGRWIEPATNSVLRVRLSDAERTMVERARDLLSHGNDRVAVKDVLTRAIAELVKRLEQSSGRTVSSTQHRFPGEETG